MKDTGFKKYKMIYLGAFLVLNFLSIYLLTSNFLLEDLSPFPRDFFMLVNSLFGDLGFFLIFIALSVLIFRSDYNRARFIMYASIAFGLLYFAFSIYFQYYGMFFSFYNLKTFSSSGAGDAAGFLFGSLLSLLKQANYIFLVPSIVLVIVFILIFYRRRKDEKFRKSSLVRGWNRLYVGAFVMVFGILLMVSSLGAYKANISDTWFEDNATPLHGVQAAGLFAYYTYDAITYIFDEQAEYSDQELEQIRQRLDTYMNKDYVSPITGQIYDNEDYRGIYFGKNLLLIQIESMNNFVIGLKVKIGDEYVELTPNLNRILNKSVYLNNYYTTVGIGNTSDSEFTTMTGLYPTGTKYSIFEYDKVQYQTLPKLFKDENYIAFSSHANTGIFYDRLIKHPELYGFDYHYCKETMDLVDPKMIHGWLNDEDFLKDTIDVMESEYQNGPVFTFAITISCHMPYNAPEETAGQGQWFYGKDNLFPKDFVLTDYTSLNEQLIGYLEHVSYTDYAIGKALEYLEASSLADDTIVVLYGDHGCGIDAFEMFYENPDLFANDINEMISYSANVTQRKLSERRMLSNVPFIIYDPTSSESSPLQPQRISLVRGFNSTSRTIAELFGLNPTYYFGVNALSSSQTIVYNPRNLDIFADGMTISGQSLDYIRDESLVDFYTPAKIDAVLEEFRKLKDFNDKLLISKIFPPLQEKGLEN